MDYGNRIKQLRLQKGYTLEELGKIVGVGKSTVRKWETGAIANMRRDKIAKLAAALGTSVNEIIGVADQSSGSPPAPAPVPDERHELLIRLFDALPSEVQDMLLVQAQALVDRQRSQDDP